MKINGYKLRGIRARTARIDTRLWQSPLLFVSFVVGAVLGSLTGTWQFTVSAAEQVLLGNGNIYEASGFWALLFFCSKYHIAVLLLATSLLGAVLIPAVFALRGFVLSCTAASIASIYPDSGLVLTAVILGLPSLLTVPSLFILGNSSFRFSAGLLSLYDRRPAAPSSDSGLLELLGCASSLVLAAAIENSLIPQIVDFLI